YARLYWFRVFNA
ncbi:hypothetical protein D039_4762B, partial [Vibrio parahaemolyticus EKP-028]